MHAKRFVKVLVIKGKKTDVGAIDSQKQAVEEKISGATIRKCAEKQVEADGADL